MEQTVAKDVGAVPVSKVAPPIRQITNQSSHFPGLLNERRIFPTPWHWCVHGLGLGQEAMGFDAKKSARLLELSLTLAQKTQSTYHAFAHQLLDGIVVTCAAISLDDSHAQQRAHDRFTRAIAQLPSDPWQYARACALLTESLVKLDQLEPYRNQLHWHLEMAFKQVTQLNPASDKLRYEKLQLFSNLLLAAGQAGFQDLLALRQPNGDTYIDIALQVATTITDVFYRGRGSAILFSVLAIIGCSAQVCHDQQNPLQILLDCFDAELSHSSSRVSDGVHDGADYYIFPLSLLLNAIAWLDCPEYLTYKRNWPQQTVSFFQALSPASKASQFMFLIHALDNLGQLDDHLADIITSFQTSIDGYLQSTSGSQVDDYLRCTYLIHLAYQLGQTDQLHPRLRSIVSDSVAKIPHSQSYLESTYGSSYMVAAYALSVFDRIGQLEQLFNNPLPLSDAIACIEEDPKSTAIHAPRTTLALIETALRMRPLQSGDTPLFRDLLDKHQGSGDDYVSEATQVCD